jgi:cell wall-associated NlpC family hydrolase
MTKLFSKWMIAALLICGLNSITAQEVINTPINKTTTQPTAVENSPVVKPVIEDDFSSRIIKKGAAVIEQAGKTITGVVEKYSKMMQVNPSSISNVIMYQFIDEWYGTRYQMGGMGKRGIDCSALVQKLYSYVYGMNVLRTSLAQFRASEFVSNIANLKEGDLVFFRIHGGPVSHVGVYLHNNYFVHASSSKGVMISKLTDAYWTKVYVGGGRLKN